MGARWEAHKLKADDISTPGKGRRARAAKQTNTFGKAEKHGNVLLTQKLFEERGAGKGVWGRPRGERAFLKPSLHKVFPTYV
jgi:hypothetical protein